MHGAHVRIVALAAVCAVAMAAIGCGNTVTSPSTQQTGTGGKSLGHLTSCLSFSGSTLCPIGTASVAFTPGNIAVLVANLLSSRANGVSSSFSATHEWSRVAENAFNNDEDNFLLYSAVSDDEVMSTLEAEQNGSALEFSPGFTGAQGGIGEYAVQVTKNGQEVRAETSTSPVAVAVLDLGQLSNGYPWHHGYRFASLCCGENNGGDNSPGHPYIAFSAGAFRWVVELGGLRQVRLPSGATVLGDRFVITEHVVPGNYVYRSFDRIDAIGDISSLTILSESTSP